MEGTTMHLITGGRLFQASGPAIENERRPKPASARGCFSRRTQVGTAG